MFCNVNGRTKVLSYKVWNGNGYGPDCAMDLLDDGGNLHDDNGNTIYTVEEYEMAVEYLVGCAKEDNKINRSDDHESFVFYEKNDVYVIDNADSFEEAKEKIEEITKEVKPTMLTDKELWSVLIKLLQEHQPHNKHGYWTDGEDILCETETQAEHLANFLEDIGLDYVNTGYYDPEEDKRENCVDDHTGYYYVGIC